MVTRQLLISLLVCACLAPSIAAAQPAAPPADDTKLAEAKELFHRGLALLDIDDPERALDYFMRSRDLVASSNNTANAAICLDRLGRYDEALELYEELLVKFGDDLDEEDRAVIGPAMAALRQKVGNVQVSANVEGTVVIDGRTRGKLPGATLIRVTAGRHSIRVTKDGYVAYEGNVEVAIGQTSQVDAHLEPLGNAGILRIEDPNLDKAEVFVDGVRVGTSPWEGIVGPGAHTVWTRKGDAGSAPSEIVVLAGQTALARTSSGSLGPDTHVEVEPVTAEIRLDRVLLGVGSWSGRLPVGNHAITVREPGFKPQILSLEVTKETKARSYPIQLVLDPTHPRWFKPSTGHAFVELVGGYLAGSSLHGDAENDCEAACSDHPFLHGYLVGARAGYRFGPGVALEIGGGYLAGQSSFQRTLLDSSTTASYQLQDELRFGGPYAAVGASYRKAFGRFGLSTRMTVGLVIASSSDAIEGTVTTDSTLPIVVEDRNESVTSFPVFIQPEIGADVALGPFRIGISSAFPFFFSDPPQLAHDQIGIAAPDCPVTAPPGSIGCLRNSDIVAGERPHGQFWLWSPQLVAGYVF